MAPDPTISRFDSIHSIQKRRSPCTRGFVIGIAIAFVLLHLLAASALVAEPEPEADTEPGASSSSQEQRRLDHPFDASAVLGVSFGIGGWDDRSFSSASTWREVKHSTLGGFAVDVSLAFQATPTIAPVLRLGFSGGSFTFDQPGFGPAGGFDGVRDPTKESRYGHFHAGVGARFTAPILPAFRVHVTAGFLLVVPFFEVFTFRDSLGSLQQWVVHQAPGPGVFLRVAAEYDVSPVVALQLQVHLDIGHTRWTRLERRAGTGTYAPTSSNTWVGVIRYETGNFSDETPTANNFDIRRHASADGGINGVIGAWGITVALVFRFG